MSDFEFERINTIKGYPELHWTGKRPYRGTNYYPAQLKEKYGEMKDDWINKIFWGDNLQVMSHMLREYRGKIDLIYIDPPFDSKMDYKKKIKIKGKEVLNDNNSFEEKQYGDIWSNDEYLQFMFERLTIMRELLSEKGSIYVHCDYHKSHHIRCMLDQVFGLGAAIDNNAPGFRGEIIWDKGFRGTESKNIFQRTHDTIFWYSKSSEWIWNQIFEEYKDKKMSRYNKVDEDGRRYALIKRTRTDGTVYYGKTYFNEEGKKIEDVIFEPIMASTDSERTDYPTQKPEDLIERFIKASSSPGDIVFDGFIGSGTTLAVAMKLGRKFIGADINLGAIQTTTKRLINVANELKEDNEKYTGFEVYNVNNYDFFRNPVEAKDLLIDALGIQKFDGNNVYDGELDGRMIKIMPVNRITTKSDLEELKANLPYQKFEKRKAENPLDPVERITIVCMGHEPDVKPSLEQDLNNYNIDIEILDILKDKSDLQFKRDSEAVIDIEENKLIIKEFYPMNLLQKLSLQKEYIEDWKQMVESVMIDWNYDGAVIEPKEIDIAEKNELVKGEYDIPENATNIKIKITDLLSETYEKEIKINE